MNKFVTQNSITMKQNKLEKLKTKGVRQAPEVDQICFTLQQPRGKDYSYKALTGAELMALLADGKHHPAVMQLRQWLPTSRGLAVEHTETSKVGRIIPSCLVRKHNDELKARRFNGIVWLDVQNVYSAEEVKRLKHAASMMPMTLAAFTGSSGMSLKILVRYWPEDGVLPREWTEVEALHHAAYRQAMALYAPLLGCPLRDMGDHLMYHSFLLSIDPEPLWHPEAVPMRVAVDRNTQPAVQDASSAPPADARHYFYYRDRFSEARKRVYQRFKQEGRDSTMEPQAFAEALTAACYEMQIPVAEARHHIAEGNTPEQTAALTHYINDYYNDRDAERSIGDKTAKGVREMEALLLRNYDFYRNAIDNATYYRPRTTTGHWQALDLAKQNGMELEVMEAGVVKSQKIVRTFLESDRIPLRDPLKEFLASVQGQSDGHDHIADLARCVCPDNPLWERVFHIWVIATVQQWMNINEKYGNALVPILCGPQGTGKSTFCRSLLPDELNWGYLDHIDLHKRENLMRIMSQMLIINIDEFDQYKGNSQRGPLKNLLQQVDVRTRQMYRSGIEVRQRRASFIATCNPTEVLIDETGNRRFFCVLVEQPIRIPARFDLFQFYAQAVDEINLRRNNPRAFAQEDITGRGWLTDEEREDVERSNSHFRVFSYAIERFKDTFEPVAERFHKGDGSCALLTRSEIFEYLSRHTEQKMNREDRTQLYQYLKDLADNGQIYKNRRNKGIAYHVRMLKRPVI